jgi:hypothetical protein
MQVGLEAPIRHLYHLLMASNDRQEPKVLNATPNLQVSFLVKGSVKSASSDGMVEVVRSAVWIVERFQ